MNAPDLISYRHKDDHQNKTRFVQNRDEPVPKWAIDVQSYTEPESNFTRAPLAEALAVPEAMRQMIVQAVRFANLAAGEGLSIDGLEPETFLSDYSATTGDEDWLTLADRVDAALRAALAAYEDHK